MKEKIIEILKSKYKTTYTNQGNYLSLDEFDFKDVAEEIEKHFKQNEAVEMYNRGYDFGMSNKKQLDSICLKFDPDVIKEANDSLCKIIEASMELEKQKGSPENHFYKSKL